MNWVLVYSSIVAVLAAGSVGMTAPQTVTPVQFFESKIRPIFVTRCASCHGEKVQMAGLKLTDPDGFFRGADNGPIVVKGDPAASRIIKAISYEAPIKMPPTGKLDESEIQALKLWVQMGAPWPTGPSTVAPARSAWDPKRTSHWAFQPVRNYNPPSVHECGWVQTPIDQFVLAQLERHELEPAPPADKLTLLRRAKFDLHGLVPTEDEIQEFLSDTAPGAFERLVDRLLASPRYGEQWGRHWLDVARYADSTGKDEDVSFDASWRYRDYVIDAFNHDLSYDQFVREQLSGDLMPADQPGRLNTRGIIATGFLALGPRAMAQIDKVREVYDTVDEQIDTTSRAFMALSVACARCHDHKFDPISTKDYYSLASIFASTKNYESHGSMLSEMYLSPLASQEVYNQYKEHQDQIKTKQLEIDAIVDPAVARFLAKELRPRLPDYMIAARRVYLEGATVTEVARKGGLQEKTLKKWVDYLKPNDEFRPYLDRWYRADSSNLRERAEECGRVYDVPFHPYYEKLMQWEQDVNKAIEQGKGLPKKPGFGEIDLKAVEERFFFEVAFGKGPFALEASEKDALLSAEERERLIALRKELETLQKSAPAKPPMANAVTDGEIVEQHVFLRGNHNNPGEIVPKQFPVILAGDHQASIQQGSGRKELGEWLASPNHRLTARVMANRIWQWHFGEGLVRTPDNFGLTGEAPTHPELLDWLARQFVQNGWSIKAMHRLIMLSSVYQLSRNATNEALAADPENRLYSRFAVRRLTVEEMRDSILALDGALNLTMGGKVGVLSREEKYDKEALVDPDKERRRSVYISYSRNKLPHTFNLFDFADSTASVGKRNETNIAPQALFMMNSEFINERARSFAKYLLAEVSLNDTARIERAYRVALARDPSPEELSDDLTYIQTYTQRFGAGPSSSLDAWRSWCHVLISSNEFNYVN